LDILQSRTGATSTTRRRRPILGVSCKRATQKRFVGQSSKPAISRIEALDFVSLARSKALAVNDPYAFLSAARAYAHGLVVKRHQFLHIDSFVVAMMVIELRR